MRTEPADQVTPVYLRLIYRDGTVDTLLYRTREHALAVLWALPLWARDGLGEWPNVARAVLVPSLYTWN